MRIDVRLFAMQRAQTGRRAVALELPDGTDVAGAWSALVADYPVLEPAADSVRFARNGRYVDAGEPLTAGDELAVIPPVAGGAEEPASSGEPGATGDPAETDGVEAPRSRRRLEVIEGSFDAGLLEDLRRGVASDADGAVVVFLGQTRESAGTPAPGQEAEAERFAGQRVTGLAYEAYEPMVTATMAQIADEMEARFGVLRLAIVHRVGEVPLGEVSVAIAVAAPHRDEAFSACRYAIEELKARAPIWKAERFADGSVWIGVPARHGPETDTTPG